MDIAKGFNSSKATMLYENAMKNIREKHRQEIDELFAHLQETGMYRQGPGYRLWTDLLAKHIEENSGAFVESMLNSTDKNHPVAPQTEEFLIERTVRHLEHLVNSDNSGFRRKLVGEGWEGDKPFVKAHLAELPYKSLAIRQYLTNRIRLHVLEINESHDNERNRLRIPI